MFSELFKQTTSNKPPSFTNLDAHIRRFIEVNEALGEISTIFESASAQTDLPSSQTDPLEQIAQMANKVRIPGFIAYHLAQEGLSLLNIIAVSAALAKRDNKLSEKQKAVLPLIEESEPLFRQTVYEMEPYKSMDANEAVRIIAARISERQKK